jgi:hypothetical protein
VAVSDFSQKGLKWQNVQNSQVAQNEFGANFGGQEKLSGMKPLNRLLLVLALAAVSTGIQFCAAQTIFGGENALGGETLRVAVTAQDVQAHRSLTDADIVYRDVSGNQCLLALVSESEKSFLTQKGFGNSLSAGSLVFKDALLPLSTRRRLLTDVPAGKQLYELGISDVRLARSLRAGDRVDVVGNLQLPEKGFVTRTLLLGAILAGIEVRDDGASCFFYLDKKDTEFVTHARRFGDLIVLARNAADVSPMSAGEGMTQSQFLNDERIRRVYENDLFQIRDGESHDSN